MKKRTVTILIGFASLAWMVVLFPVYAQEDMTVLADEAFGKGQRPPAVFVHDDHNEKAELDDCAVCHHVYREGVLVEDESSEDMQCSDCHNVKEGYPTPPLMKAYHTRCQGCHKEEGSGPITCGECHVRGGAVSHDNHDEGH